MILYGIGRGLVMEISKHWQRNTDTQTRDTHACMHPCLALLLKGQLVSRTCSHTGSFSSGIRSRLFQEASTSAESSRNRNKLFLQPDSFVSSGKEEHIVATGPSLQIYPDRWQLRNSICQKLLPSLPLSTVLLACRLPAVMEEA